MAKCRCVHDYSSGLFVCTVPEDATHVTHAAGEGEHPATVKEPGVVSSDDTPAGELDSGSTHVQESCEDGDPDDRIPAKDFEPSQSSEKFSNHSLPDDLDSTQEGAREREDHGDSESTQKPLDDTGYTSEELFDDDVDPEGNKHNWIHYKTVLTWTFLLLYAQISP